MAEETEISTPVEETAEDTTSSILATNLIDCFFVISLII